MPVLQRVVSLAYRDSARCALAAHGRAILIESGLHTRELRFSRALGPGTFVDSLWWHG